MEMCALDAPLYPSVYPRTLPGASNTCILVTTTFGSLRQTRRIQATRNPFDEVVKLDEQDLAVP